MYPVSDDYKQAVYTDKRRTTARVVFEVLDVDAFEDNTKTATSEAPISRLAQVTNKVRGMSAKYATYEPEYFKLDGSFTIPPKPDQKPEAELGWWSGVLSEADGTFDPPQVLEFVFTKDHSSMGISIAFDDATNEYAADFDINIYDASNALIHSEQVTNNDNARYVLVKQLDNYRKVEVVIKKWAIGYRRARVVEVDFGVVKEYGPSQLIRLNVLREISLTGKTIPSSELTFTVDNSSKEFNILNPEGFYRFLQERQEAKLDMGIEVSPGTFEYIPMGKFYLYDWKSDEGSLTTTFTALDIIRLLDDYEMESPTPDTKTLYALTEEVFSTAGITDYEIDAALQNINTQAVFRKMTTRALIQHICVAGCAVLFSDRDGKLVIKQLEDAEPVDNVTFDSAYQEPQIKLDRLISAVEVNIYDNGTISDTFKLSNGPKGEVYKVDNPLINDVTTAHTVAEWILATLNKRAIHEVDWRQNPALDLGDVLTVENAYGTDVPAKIFKQEIEFQGYISGRTELRGEIGGD